MKNEQHTDEETDACEYCGEHRDEMGTCVNSMCATNDDTRCLCCGKKLASDGGCNNKQCLRGRGNWSENI